MQHRPAPGDPISSGIRFLLGKETLELGWRDGGRREEGRGK